MGLIKDINTLNKGIYPSDWPCSLCNRPFVVHVKIGDPNEEANGAYPAHRQWCYSYVRNDPEYENRDKRNNIFTPMDNLSYVEMKAKKVLE